MKAKNFPGRKNDRRISALSRLDTAKDVTSFAAGKESATLNRLIVPVGTAKTFTKKDRSAKGKDKK
jgi:hypothetical protein